ncbi:hypothetical protein P43SY_000864 [Pythium insidiosum]|uniref:Poly [ADP-ribose] polymerase n=1 Tax=Pythium insidiosum TaxID=114742 RepID=A0AAD5M5X1_PYTIN|nr:hypothetical protein P43SY_000864 [Pythium insidiosum]
MCNQPKSTAAIAAIATRPKSESESPLKRRWTERDWDVLMEAQSFVAVYADTSSPNESAAPAAAPTETKSTKQQRKTRSKTKKARKAPDNHSDNHNEAARSEDAPSAPETATAAPAEAAFWLAQLQDDVTEDMLGTDASVRITWLNCVDGAVYEFAYDDCVDVESILCHVYVRQVVADKRVELTDATKAPKMSKRIAAMHIPPQYATVRMDAYEDRELSGTHAFSSFKGDVISANREVIRALRTRNNDLLRELVETPHVRREIQSFSARQSADVKRTAFGRGGKEGNNALLEDTNLCGNDTDNAYFWSCPKSTLKMLMVLYPSGEWTNDYAIPDHIAKAARVGNYKLVHKLVETLEKNGGWGFNDLHRMACVDFILRKDTAQQFLDFRDREGCTMLFLQCQHSNNIAHIQFLLDKGLNPNISNCDGEFPLEKLIHRYGGKSNGGLFFMDAIRLLVDRGALVEYEDEPVENGFVRRRTQPLALSVQYDLKDVFAFLLERGADPLKLGSFGTGCWDVCARMGAKGSYYLRLLLQHVDKKSGSVKLSGDFFHAIASTGRAGMIDVKLVEECIEKISDDVSIEDALAREQLQLATNLMVGLEVSNDRHLLRSGNSRGETLLHCLAKYNSNFNGLAVDLAWTLVDDGLDVSSGDSEGNTALHYAAANGNLAGDKDLFQNEKLGSSVSVKVPALIRAAYVSDPEMTEEISEKSSRYYEVVPRNEDHFGEAIKAFDKVSDVDHESYRIKKLLEITHTYKMILGAKLRQTVVNPIEYMYDALQIKANVLSPDTAEHALLKQYFFAGLRPDDQKRYQISNIFSVERRHESERYMNLVNSDATFKSRHSKLLWHGTRRTNLMGILSEGLRIAPPEAPHHGYSYGKGIYFADVSGKSLNYCGTPYFIAKKGAQITSPFGRREGKNIHYMLLCEVALGNQMEVQKSCQWNEQLPKCVNSICALGQHVPDESLAIVSPLSGVKIPSGRVGRPGVDFPVPTVWATTKVQRNRSGYYNSGDERWSLEAEAYLNHLIDVVHEGNVGLHQSFELEDSLKAHFVPQNYYSYGDAAMPTAVQVKVSDLRSTNAHTPDSRHPWDVTVEINITKSDGATESYKARRYLNVVYSDTNTDGFSFRQTSHNNQYNEHVVFNTAQARIRYLVEIELLNSYY